MGEKETFTCQNSSCKKSFTAPLKTLNLQQDPKERYFACPYCLTKIEISKEPFKTEEAILEKAQQKVKNDDKPSVCYYHPGYLSERSSKEQIPDDCLVCKDIVDCMLKKMHE